MNLVSKITKEIENGFNPNIGITSLLVPKKWSNEKVKDYLNKLSKGDKRCKPKFN